MKCIHVECHRESQPERKKCWYHLKRGSEDARAQEARKQLRAEMKRREQLSKERRAREKAKAAAIRIEVSKLMEATL